jgi:ribonuclease T
MSEQQTFSDSDINTAENIDEVEKTLMSQRFRGYLPVVVDVETGGLNPRTDALLEIAAVMLVMNDKGLLEVGEHKRYHVNAFEGANIDPKSLEINGIKPDSPLRAAVDERDALGNIFSMIRQEQKKQACTRSILIGHNSFFDLQFLNAAVERTGIKRNPFHPFSSLDTASLSALTYGQTVLARGIAAAEIEWDGREAHSALYDARKTAELFCKIVNRYKELGGWPLQP